ncbi:hypothetical protein [Nocardia salmonicida]|uniref:hypothetical protein n=1 Tax=Nocardia salmonicida TaxID=53431 RepID=UPI002E2D6586|nr:hypothetical protein [Nocardia salmonicida]
MSDLEGARTLYRDLFQKLGIDGFPDNPVGPLRVWWTQEGTQTTCFLIHFAWMIQHLSRNITSRSEPIFYEKVKRLFTEITDSAYAENLAELEVAFIISHAMSPLSCEPMVPAELIGSASQPKSPDFGIRLPSGDIAIEVTVWHWQSLRDWDAACGEISLRMGARLRRARLGRQVRLGLPLHVQGADIEAIASSNVVDTMRASAGEATVNLSAGEATLQWSEFPVFASFEEAAGGWQMAKGFGMGAVGSIEKPFGFAVYPVLDERAIDEAANSLRKALDRKRRQVVDSVPNIIALGLGHHILDWDWVLPMFTERIWPNPKYKWITALAAFTPERAWDQPTSTAMINFCWNPNAAVQAPQSLRDVAEGRATFHHP